MVRDYSKGKIYCIKVNTNEEYLPYIGSTTKQYLSQRIEKHHSNYKYWKKNGKGFMSSFTLFEKYGFNECYIELLELCPCSCSEELRKKEREWFDKLNCVNMTRPFVTKEERVEYFKNYNEEHKEEIAEKKKIYHEEHKEEITEKRKIIYENNKEEILQKNKKYRDEHKEEIIIKARIKYHKNKEELSEKKKETYECPCGSVCRKSDKARHEKSKKHQDYLSTIGTICVSAIA
jgi:hypothetical protein